MGLPKGKGSSPNHQFSGGEHVTFRESVIHKPEGHFGRILLPQGDRGPAEIQVTNKKHMTNERLAGKSTMNEDVFPIEKY